MGRVDRREAQAGPQGTGRSAGSRASGRIGAPGCGGLCPKVLALALVFLGAHEAPGRVRGSSAGRVRAPRTPLPCPSRVSRHPGPPLGEPTRRKWLRAPTPCFRVRAGGFRVRAGAPHMLHVEMPSMCALCGAVRVSALPQRGPELGLRGGGCASRPSPPPDAPSPRRALRRGHEKETMNSFLLLPTLPGKVPGWANPAAGRQFGSDRTSLLRLR